MVGINPMQYLEGHRLISDPHRPMEVFQPKREWVDGHWVIGGKVIMYEYQYPLISGSARVFKTEKGGNMLRPIGTEFIEECPADECSTDSRATRITWRVVAHVEAIDEFRRPFIAEELKAIKREYLGGYHEEV